MTGAPPLRILEVAALPFPSRQGTQVMLHHLCEGLARRGHEVHLLVHAHGAFGPRASYAIRRLPDFPRLRSLRSGPSWRRAALDLGLACAIRSSVREIRPDVVHLHNVEAGAAALLLPPRPAVPCVYHAHNLMSEELPTFASPLLRSLARRFGARLDAELPRRADRTLAISGATRDALLRRGADPDRTVTVEPGIDLTDLEAAAAADPAERPIRIDGRPTLCFVGNLDRYQGIDLLLEAAADLRRRGRDPTILLVTESDPGPTRAAAARIGVRVRAERHGPLDHALVAARSCDLAVIARSAPGGFPMKLALLLAAGVPVVATPIAAAGLGLGGVVRAAAAPSASALADAIEAALADPHLRRRAALGRHLARTRWSPEAAAERTERELRTAIRTR